MFNNRYIVNYISVSLSWGFTAQSTQWGHVDHNQLYLWYLNYIPDSSRKNPRFLDRQAWAKIVDPDQMPQDVAFDQGLHHLPFNLCHAE